MPEEMQKLRNALNVRGIEWTDSTRDEKRSFPFMDMNIYGTKFSFQNSTYEVISGFGTLGGQWGLLELRRLSHDPKGSLTAEGVLSIMDGRNNDKF